MNIEPLRDALLPCPFCGGEVEYVMPPCSDLAEYVRHKQPNHCPVEFTAFTLDGGREMIAAWNTRSPDPEIARQREVIEAWRDIDRKRDAEVERLREALRNIVNYDTSEFPERGEDICEHYYPLKEIASAAIKEPSHDEG